MEHDYSDEQMMLATQIAYLGDDMSAEGMENKTVGEIVNTYMSYVKTDYSGRPVKNEAGFYVVDSEKVIDTKSAEISKRLEVITNIVEATNKNPNLAGWEEWKVVDVCHHNRTSGYYGVLIETETGKAILANRGSESYNFYQVLIDWGVADLALLNNVLTLQQGDSQKYIKEIWNKYGDEYKYSITGHSLGGNLAQHQTVMAPDEMKKHIDHTISFDGPGFSDEYNIRHMVEIESVVGKMDHYQWSLISTLLIPIPGTRERIIAATDDLYHSGISGSLYRHDTRNVLFDENGNVIPGKPSLLQDLTSDYSKMLELLPLEMMAYGPQFSPFMVAYLAGAALVVMAAQGLKDISSQLKAGVEQIYYNYLVPDVSGTYEVDINSMNAIGQEIESKAAYLMEISQEIDVLRKNIKYFSGAGAYISSRLMRLQFSLENKIKEISQEGFNVQSYATAYGNTDKSVSDNFAGIYVVENS